MKASVAVALLGTASGVLANSNVQFFYTDTEDLCSYGGSSMPANEQTTHGGVCAYRLDVARVYGCPAPDPTCWTWGQTCNNNLVGQTVCNRNGAQWCCNAVAEETCTTTEGQINVCISNFTSPNSGVSIEAANEVYASAIGVNNVTADVTATSQSIQPTPFSTLILGVVADSPSTTSSSAGTTATTSPVGTSDNSQSAPTASSTANSAPGENALVPASQGISSAAIGGIVVGAIAVIALIGFGVFFLRRKRRTAGAASSNGNLEARNDKGPNVTTALVSEVEHDQRDYGNFYGKPQYLQQRSEVRSELGSETQRTELSSTTPASPAPGRYEMP